MLSHGRAVQVLRANVPAAQVGIVNITSPAEPFSDSDADRDAARQLDGSFNRWFLDPIFHGRYPADAIADRVRRGHLPSAEMDFVQPGDLATMSTPVDFLGLNYYSRIVVQAGEDGAPKSVRMAPAEELTDMGWEVHPQGLTESLIRIHRDYAPRTIHITENGAAFLDAPGETAAFADARRVEFLRAHFDAAAAALAAGVPLAAYFVWSLLDNFEWGEGLSKRFGLFHVDFANQRRTPRDSAHWYREFLSHRSALAATPRSHHRRDP
jgi:beta-glucosidase